jgi:hypothetical protein
MVDMQCVLPRRAGAIATCWVPAFAMGAIWNNRGTVKPFDSALALTVP